MQEAGFQLAPVEGSQGGTLALLGPFSFPLGCCPGKGTVINILGFCVYPCWWAGRGGGGWAAPGWVGGAAHAEGHEEGPWKGTRLEQRARRVHGEFLGCWEISLARAGVTPKSREGN